MTETVGGVTLGYCETGKREQRDRADQDHDEREHVGEDRPFDENPRKHRVARSSGIDTAALHCGSLTVRPRRHHGLLLRVDLVAGDGALQTAQ